MSEPLSREERAEFNAINRDHATPIVQLSQDEYRALRDALVAAEARAVRCEGELDEIKTGVRAIADRLWNLDYKEARELSVLLRDAT